MTPIKVESKKAYELIKKGNNPFNLIYFSSEKSFIVCIGNKPIDIVDFIDIMSKRAILNDDFDYISRKLSELDYEIANMFIIAYEINNNL